MVITPPIIALIMTRMTIKPPLRIDPKGLSYGFAFLLKAALAQFLPAYVSIPHSSGQMLTGSPVSKAEPRGESAISVRSVRQLM
jgi:hypothetical protein